MTAALPVMPAAQLKDLSFTTLADSTCLKATICWGNEEYDVTLKGKLGLTKDEAESLLLSRVSDLYLLKARYLGQTVEKIKWKTDTNTLERTFSDLNQHKRGVKTISLDHWQDRLGEKIKKNYKKWTHLEQMNQEAEAISKKAQATIRSAESERTQVYLLNPANKLSSTFEKDLKSITLVIRQAQGKIKEATHLKALAEAQQKKIRDRIIRIKNIENITTNNN